MTHKVSLKEFSIKHFDPYPKTVCAAKNPEKIAHQWGPVNCKRCLKFKDTKGEGGK